MKHCPYAPLVYGIDGRNIFCDICNSIKKSLSRANFLMNYTGILENDLSLAT